MPRLLILAASIAALGPAHAQMPPLVDFTPQVVESAALYEMERKLCVENDLRNDPQCRRYFTTAPRTGRRDANAPKQSSPRRTEVTRSSDAKK